MANFCKWGCPTRVDGPGESCGMCCEAAIKEREAKHAEQQSSSISSEVIQIDIVQSETQPDIEEKVVVELEPAPKPPAFQPAAAKKKRNN